MTSTALPTELFPVPTRTRVLDQRSAGFEEFDRFLDLVLDAAGTPRSTFTSQLRENLYDLSEQTPDFRAVHQVVELLVAHHRSTGASIRPTVLRSLLEHERQAHVLQLPELAAGPRLTFRRKDKSELLAAVIRRRFPDPLAFADVAARRLNPFDAAEFLAEARRSDRSYRLALTSLCLTHSPGDLVLRLLTPEQVHEEMADLHLDPVHGTRSVEEQAHLLVRGLGFTLVDPPVGLQDFKAAVLTAKALVEDADKGTERLLGATSTVVVHVEAALRDLLHFWATYLFDSIGDLVKTRNARTSGHPPLVVRSLSTDGVVELLHFLNAEAQGEDFRFRLAAVELEQPLSAALLAACDGFLKRRRVFHAVPTASDLPVEESAALQQLCERLVQSAADLLDQASDGSFPAVIKLSEIVFDEYSRRIFTGVNSEGGQVRFGITERQDPEDLVVAAHYYMLPDKRVSVNPRLVPRAGRRPQVLFDSGRRYESASQTQRRQGQRLLTYVDLRPDARVLEVGCGTGALALDVARRVAHLHGIDVSPEMLSVAEDRAEEAGLHNLTFEVADLLDYAAPEPFDLVLSNSTMHWILPPERAYGQLLHALGPGGRLAVHQGGAGNYRGLRECVSRVIRRLRLSEFFDGWKYPAYYPDVLELRDLLVSVGFAEVDVHPVESDGSESPTLVHDFAAAGLLPFLHVLPETQREVLRTAFLEEAETVQPDLYTHRLYVTARRP
jgi:trans-aconitate methyltransferase